MEKQIGIVLLVFLIALSGCKKDDSVGNQPRILEELAVVFKEHPEAQADHFDFPVGKPDAKGYYVAQTFLENTHLGEDWNGANGGNSDLGDPIYSAANGYIRFARNFGNGWGNVICIIHKLPDESGKSEPVYVETLYAHLKAILVKSGEIVKVGDNIGTMGNVDGKYYAHLHFEIRSNIFLPIGKGYGKSKGFLDPSAFIRSHRR